jgi:hypothetical protein
VGQQNRVGVRASTLTLFWLYPVLHGLFPYYFGTLSDVGLAMINCTVSGAEKKVLEAKDIAELAKKTT